MNEAWNHALLVITVFAGWSVAVAYLGGMKIFWDYETFDDPANKADR